MRVRKLTAREAARNAVLDFFKAKGLNKCIWELSSIPPTTAQYIGPEHWLHISAVLLIAEKFPELKAWHVPNEGKTGRFASAHIKQLLGVIPGVSDLFVQRTGCAQMLVLEFKAKGNKPTKEQVDFLAFQRSCGHLTAVPYTMEEVLSELISYTVGLQGENI